MSNMRKMRNVGPKPRKSGGPERASARREWGPEGRGPDLEKVRAPRVGA